MSMTLLFDGSWETLNIRPHTQGRTKKFIDKKEASTFHVVHRSQQDKAKEGEEAASEFVLIPSGVCIVRGRGGATLKG